MASAKCTDSQKSPTLNCREHLIGDANRKHNIMITPTAKPRLGIAIFAMTLHNAVLRRVHKQYPCTRVLMQP